MTVIHLLIKLFSYLFIAKPLALCLVSQLANKEKQINKQTIILKCINKGKINYYFPEDTIDLRNAEIRQHCAVI